MTRASSFGSACFSWLPHLLTGTNPRRRVIPFDLQPVGTPVGSSRSQRGSQNSRTFVAAHMVPWRSRTKVVTSARTLPTLRKTRALALRSPRVSLRERWQNQRVAGAVVTTHAKAPSHVRKNDSVRSSWNDARLLARLASSPVHLSICARRGGLAAVLAPLRFFFSSGTSWLRFVLTSGLGAVQGDEVVLSHHCDRAPCSLAVLWRTEIWR